MSRHFKSRQASDYLAEGGLQRSVSWLQKRRLQGSEDPRDPGPNWYRDPAGVCLYRQEDLDRYIRAQLALLQPRAPAPMPENFRKGTPTDESTR